MAGSLTAAMKLYERREYTQAEQAFVSLVDTTAAGVIAGFRRAECLSRLGRHEEAIEIARAAQGADPAHPPAALWLAQTLAEAGQYAEAAAIEVPGLLEGEPELLAAGFRAVAAIVAGDRSNPVETACAVHASAHPPVWSLALRAAERARLTSEHRWPDLATVFRVSEAFDEADAKGVRPHADVAAPGSSGPSVLLRYQASLFHAFGDWPRIVEVARPYLLALSDKEEARFEEHLLVGENAEARAFVFELGEKYGDQSAGEIAIGCARTAQIDGEAARPDQFPGAEAARKSLDLFVDWLDLGALLMEGDDIAARAAADAIVSSGYAGTTPEIALLRWVLPTAESTNAARP